MILYIISCLDTRSCACTYTSLLACLNVSACACTCIWPLPYWTGASPGGERRHATHGHKIARVFPAWGCHRVPAPGGHAHARWRGRGVFPWYFDRNNEKILGCTTVNRLYITPLGDVLVCPYVHIKIGNIFKNSLKEIVDYGFSIKYFRNHSDLCLAGEDKEFIKKFMSRDGQTIFNPALAEDIFSKEDFIK